MHHNSSGAKKSLYVFLSSLLGVFLFFILHRAILFLYLYLVGDGYFVYTFVYWRLLAIDYITLVLTLMGGAWYGVWLGLYWYGKIYEEGSHGGFADHLVRSYWSGQNPKTLGAKIATVKEHIEKDLWDLESLAKSTTKSVIVSPEPKVRKIIRKQAPKKLKTIK